MFFLDFRQDSFPKCGYYNGSFVPWLEPELGALNRDRPLFARPQSGLNLGLDRSLFARPLSGSISILADPDLDKFLGLELNSPTSHHSSILQWRTSIHHASILISHTKGKLDFDHIHWQTSLKKNTFFTFRFVWD